MPPYNQSNNYTSEWGPTRQTGQRVINSDGSYGANYGSGVSTGSSPRKFDECGLDVADMNALDPDVARQLESGLIDANDICNNTEDVPPPTQTFRRKVKKMVEVPVIRKVKVPTTQPTIVPVTEKQKIQVKKTVPVETSKWVEEAYTDIEDRPATRMKEVWIKKMVPEQYNKKVEVRKTRRVQVPVQTYQEVTEEKVVEIETNKLENVPGWRLDEVKDTKMVEIEGWQEVELVPRVKDTNVHIEKTFEHQRTRRHVERKRGTEVVEDTDHRLDNVDTDSDGDEVEITSVGIVKLDGSEHRTRPPKRSHRAPRSHRFLTGASTPAPPAVNSTVTEASPQKTLTPAPPAEVAEERSLTPRGGNKMFGVRMSARREGLFVLEVAPGGFAMEAGLQGGDTIVSVDGSKISSVKGWRAMLANKEQGDFLTMVVKDASGSTKPAAVLLDGFNPEHYV